MKNKGTLVIAPMHPMDSGDTYPVAFANEIKGGHHQVTTIADRNAITSDRLMAGMLVTVTQDVSVTPAATRTYQYTGDGWVLFSSGSSTSSVGATGATGPQGPQGSQGIAGSNGSNGATGPQGDTGASGSQGYQGVTGRNMTVNAFGTTGILDDVEDSAKQGPWGTDFALEYGHARDYGYVVVDTTLALLYIKQSSTKADWTAGIAFVPGPQGDMGGVGATGPQGNVGATGPQGSSGSQGASGPQGVQGSVGATGATGSQGFTGLAGSVGATGPQGSQGAAGARGESFNVDATSLDGIRSSYTNSDAGFTWLDTTLGLLYFKTGGAGVDTWSAGIPFGRGDTGATGPQGSQGASGPQGHQGTQGVSGPQGSQGVTGAGATGATGPQGPQGASGPQGSQGVTGAGVTGATGPVGATGPQGPQGSGSGSSSGTAGGLNALVEYVAVPTPGIRTVIKSSSTVFQGTYTATSTLITFELVAQPFSVNDYAVIRDTAGNTVHGKVTSVATDTVTVTKTDSSATLTASGTGYIQVAYGYDHVDTNSTVVTTYSNSDIVGGITREPANPMRHGIKMHAIAFMSVLRASGKARLAPFTAATSQGCYTISLPFGTYDGIYDDLEGTVGTPSEYHLMYPHVTCYTIGQSMVQNANMLYPQMLPTNRKMMFLEFGTSTGSMSGSYVVRMIF